MMQCPMLHHNIALFNCNNTFTFKNIIKSHWPKVGIIWICIFDQINAAQKYIFILLQFKITAYNLSVCDDEAITPVFSVARSFKNDFNMLNRFRSIIYSIIFVETKYIHTFFRILNFWTIYVMLCCYIYTFANLFLYLLANKYCAVYYCRNLDCYCQVFMYSVVLQVWKSFMCNAHISVFASARENERKRSCNVKCDICCLALHAASCVISAVLNIMLVYEWTSYFLSLKIDFRDFQSALMN